MLHYEKRTFMQQYGMDFFEPYYGDCATMTYAITKAEKIVVLDMVVYCLTENTSQTAGYCGISSENYIYMSQWRSVKALFEQEKHFDEYNVFYVAERIFQNYVSSLKALCIGKWRDRYATPVDKVTLDDIMKRLEENLKATGELFLLMGEKGFESLITNVESIKVFSDEDIEIAAQESWLCPLIKLVLKRSTLSHLEQLEAVCDFLLCEENTWCIGIYAFYELVEKCEHDEQVLCRDKLENVHMKIDELMKELSGTWMMNLIA